MTQTPKISVIIPVFNMEPFLAEALDSVLRQTLTELEVICVDDGSTDQSLRILNDYAARDSRIVVRTQPNQRQGAARNNALKIARGEYVAFLDSDDTYELTFCEKMFRKAQETGAEIVCCFFCENRVAGTHYVPEGIDFSACKTSIEDRLKTYDQMGGSACQRLWKRDFLVKNRLLFETGIFFEDMPFVLRGTALASKIACLPDFLYVYRYRGESSCHSLAHFPDMPPAWKCTYEGLKSIPGTEDYCRRLLIEKWEHFSCVYYIHLAQKRKIRVRFSKCLRQFTLPEEAGLLEGFGRKDLAAFCRLMTAGPLKRFWIRLKEKGKIFGKKNSE